MDLLEWWCVGIETGIAILKAVGVQWKLKMCESQKMKLYSWKGLFSDLLEKVKVLREDPPISSTEWKHVGEFFWDSFSGEAYQGLIGKNHPGMDIGIGFTDNPCRICNIVQQSVCLTRIVRNWWHNIRSRFPPGVSWVCITGNSQPCLSTQ